MMLHLGQQDRVAFPEILQPPGLGDEVQALGGAPRENDFVAADGV